MGLQLLARSYVEHGIALGNPCPLPPCIFSLSPQKKSPRALWMCPSGRPRDSRETFLWTLWGQPTRASTSPWGPCQLVEIATPASLGPHVEPRVLPTPMPPSYLRTPSLHHCPSSSKEPAMLIRRPSGRV